MSDGPSPALAPPAALGVFEAYGIETEYMIVDAQTLDIAAGAPAMLRELRGVPPSQPAPQEAPAGGLAWSNELVAHVIELKNPRPGPLAGLTERFCAEAKALARRAQASGLALMPGAMHPWMRPDEAELWRHGNAAVYRAFDRAFGCLGHGWTNVQSTHINLPFRGDEEFSRLHAAVRVVLPLIPALAASSPFAEGRRAPALDFRLSAYRHHADAVPSVVGKVIPDAYAARAEYESQLLQPLYRDMRPRDPEGVLQQEWLNARGAIARFDRSALEIRVMDAQEYAGMDIALAALIIDAVWWLYGRAPSALSTDGLSDILDRCARDAEQAVIECPEFLAALDISARSLTAAALWESMAERLQREAAPHVALWSEALSFLLSRGTLASRLVRAAGPRPRRQDLHRVYRELCRCVELGSRFDCR